MKTPFCYIQLHNWKYSKEKHKVDGHPNNREYVRVVVRECKWCGHREHHELPRINKKFGTWKNFDDISKEDSIKFNRL